MTIEKAGQNWNNRKNLELRVARMLRFKNSVALTYFEVRGEVGLMLQGASTQAGKGHDVFWNWPDIPFDAPLLCFFLKIRKTERRALFRGMVFGKDRRQLTMKFMKETFFMLFEKCQRRLTKTIER